MGYCTFEILQFFSHWISRQKVQNLIYSNPETAKFRISSVPGYCTFWFVHCVVKFSVKVIWSKLQIFKGTVTIKTDSFWFSSIKNTNSSSSTPMAPYDDILSLISTDNGDFSVLSLENRENRCETWKNHNFWSFSQNSEKKTRIDAKRN